MGGFFDFFLRGDEFWDGINCKGFGGLIGGQKWHLSKLLPDADLKTKITMLIILNKLKYGEETFF